MIGYCNWLTTASSNDSNVCLYSEYKYCIIITAELATVMEVVMYYKKTLNQMLATTCSDCCKVTATNCSRCVEESYPVI